MKLPSPKLWLPILLLVAGGLGVAGLVATRPLPEPEPPQVHSPLVRVKRVTQGPFRFVVKTQGQVEPRRQGSLIPQVSGEVVWVSPDLVAGGFFEEQQPLLRIDRADAEVAVEEARAAVARAESEARRAHKELERQRRLAHQSITSQAKIDDAENAARVADAGLREARARLTQAEQNLERTEIRAPYAGRVRSESVDVGQFVRRGEPVAQIYAIDYAEVRLPIPDRELRYLDLSLGHRPRARLTAPQPGEVERSPSGPRLAHPEGPEVLLHAEFAGRAYTWEGRIVRTEGEIDPKSRMITLVARVDDPYGRQEGADRPPLAVGLFVQAEVLGRRLPAAVVLPRAALRSGDRVLVVDAEQRLHFRPVEVLRQERERVVLGGGLEAGERVCVSPLPGAVEGMQVQVAEAATAAGVARVGS